ncbi:oligopeptide transporter subunit; ATP-binding component of ABC superfamily [Desulfamplus magnetovallimortis]|uniref:Oligopeptide transporter subunit ATP-binding component of ABC superfamily n=1 Tax=Desulfamplus magnetovallimortis TaxID=1246637 RepID=A0A1W1H8L6_9BACT|nr:ABC transporter ATP-binding protein [Desulfamplus magnetovallimortis]SLM28811.1 oligopeptide transporter subunit; ATP-binding component of ABC superfamily [Desulfamplus magnetovallimortis]
MSQKILTVSNLAVSFQTESGTLSAVDGVSFELKKGSTLGIAGESGCGKSVTALSIISLLPKPSGRIDSGSVILHGCRNSQSFAGHSMLNSKQPWPLSGTPDHENGGKNGNENGNIELLNLDPEKMRTIRGRNISMIFQEPMTALNPVYKIKKQMLEVYSIHFPDMTRQQMTRDATDMLKQVGIANPDKIIECYPHQLSGGMRQRVMIAMALATKPDILIADEPTTALDVTVQAQILELISTLQREMGMSVILITHDLGVIAENCEDAVVMYGGRVAERAGVKELFKNPSHPYTKGLLNSIPALAATPKTTLPAIRGRVPSLEEMPIGCRFSTRCPDVMDICLKISPAETEIATCHFSACHLHEKTFKVANDFSNLQPDK